MKARHIEVILIISLLVGLVGVVDAHLPGGVTYMSFQFPDHLLPILDGNLSDWDILPGGYVIMTEDMYEQLAGMGKDGSGVDLVDLALRSACGWNDATNRLYFMAEVFDDIHNTDRTDPQCNWTDDCWEIMIDANHSGGRHAWFGDLTNEEDKRLNGAAGTQYILAEPPVGGVDITSQNASTWTSEPGEWFDVGWNFTGDEFGESTYYYELFIYPFDDLNWEGPDVSRHHDLAEGEILGIGWAFADFDALGDQYDAYWTISGGNSTCGFSEALADMYLAPLEPGLPGVDPNRSLVNNVSVVPMKPNLIGTVDISADVADPNGVSSVSARIWSSDGAVDESVPMVDQGGGTYAGAWTTEAAPRNYLVDIIVEDGASDMDSTYMEASFWTTNVPPFLRILLPGVAFPGMDVSIDAEVVLDLDLDAVPTVNTEIEDPDIGAVVAVLPGGSGVWTVPSDPAEWYMVAVTGEDERSGIRRKERWLDVLIPEVLSNPTMAPPAVPGEGLRADFVAVDSGPPGLDEVELIIELGPENPSFIDAASAIIGPVDLLGSDFPFGNGEDHAFVSRLEGFVHIAEPGPYTFVVSSDDDHRLLIGGIPLAEGGCCGWGPTGLVEFTVPGLYPIKLLHIEAVDVEQLSLYYARGLHPGYDGEVFSLVPAEMLFPDLPPVVLQVGHEAANPGGVAVVPVFAHHMTDRGIVSGELVFRFDPDLLTFVGAESGKHQMMYMDANATGAGEARVSFAATGPLIDVMGGVLVMAAFKVHPNAARGAETPVTLWASLNEGEPVPETFPGSVLIDLVGDASRNGEIRSMDASLILMHAVRNLDLIIDYFEGDRRSCMLICDVNRDGDLSAMDAARILQFMVRRIPGLPYPGGEEMAKSMASDPPGFSISGDVDYTDGRLQVTIEGDDLSGVIAGAWTVAYDATQLNILSVSPGHGLVGALFEHAVEDGKVRMAFASSEALEDSDGLVSLTFEVLAGEEDLTEPALMMIQDVRLNEGRVPVEGGEWEVSLARTAAPAEYALSQNFPNPFNPQTTIHYALARSGPIELAIYDVNGQRVRGLVDGLQEMGEHTATWDGQDDRGKAVASGVYFCRLQADGFVDTRKLVFVR